MKTLIKFTCVSLMFILLPFYTYSQNSECLSGDCDNGYGTYIWGKASPRSGDKYVGYWKNGEMHGQGTYYWKDGSKYTGNWNGGMQSGQGSFYNTSGKLESTGIWENGKITQKTNENATGCISGDCEDGYGLYQWDDGDKYEGYWENGNMNGQGTYTWKNGASYVGNFVDNEFNGKGTYLSFEKDKYIGEWKDGSKHGYGTMYYADGSVEEGVWENDKYKGSENEITDCISGDCGNGYGTYVWKGGEKYEGNWKDFMRNGQGTNYYEDGTVYTGEWKDDNRNGYGTYKKLDGTTQTGMWENNRYIGTGTNNTACISGDCKEGYGVYVWDTGEKYEGNWKKGMRNGEGTNYYKDGNVYSGQWKDDMQHGYGTLTYTKSSEFDKYVGDYVEHKKTGFGTLTYKNGQKYSGEFKDGYFHGTGTMTYADGRKESGQWEWDVFKGKSDKVTTGCIAGDCKNGYGTFVYDNGSRYTGNFKDGYLSGQGTYTTETGDEYIGQFSDGTYNGQGTYTFKSDKTYKKYIGEWASGNFNGKGTMYYTDGTSKTGTWKDGEFVNEIKNDAKPPVLTWLTPQLFNTSSQTSELSIKVCIKSAIEVENIQVFVNDKLQINSPARGYSVVNTNCDITFERSIALENGDNAIKVIVKNAAGSTTSDLRYVKYESAIQTASEKRLALVIGNSKYTAAPLRNPANDAKAIGAQLQKLGFEVMLYTDLSQNDMKVKMREFGDKLSKQKGVGLFYFAGHGLQLNGENYLVPVDARIEKEQDVELESVNLKRIMGEMDYAQNDLNIVILDACRNNPFARSLRSGGNNGLATTTAPQGTFIAYATAPGSVAADGEGLNGLYTEELLKALEIPNMKIEDVFKTVRNNVFKKSNKQQVPWENSSIFGDFYFKK